MELPDDLKQDLEFWRKQFAPVYVCWYISANLFSSETKQDIFGYAQSFIWGNLSKLCTMAILIMTTSLFDNSTYQGHARRNLLQFKKKCCKSDILQIKNIGVRFNKFAKLGSGMWDRYRHPLSHGHNHDSEANIGLKQLYNVFLLLPNTIEYERLEELVLGIRNFLNELADIYDLSPIEAPSNLDFLIKNFANYLKCGYKVSIQDTQI